MVTSNSIKRLSNSRQRRRGLYLAVCLVFCGSLIIGSNIAAANGSAIPRQILSSFSYEGPYINDLAFYFYHGADAQWSALVDGVIDVGNELINPEEASEIDCDEIVADAFWGIACSTHDDPFFFEEDYYPDTPVPLPISGWPLNHLPLRRAIAMAIDKEYLADISFEYGVALDHVVPECFGEWSNPDLPSDYRSGDLEGANTLLDDSGFEDRNGDGYRDAPDSDNEVNINLFYAPLEWYPKADSHSVLLTDNNVIAEYIGEILGELGFQYTVNRVLPEVLYYITHYGTRGYHLALIPFFLKGLHLNTGTRPITIPLYIKDWFYSWSIPYTNIFNYDNETCDADIEALDTTPDYNDFKELVWDIQENVAENQPIIPLITTKVFTAHRNDRFEEWVNTPYIGSSNYWSLLQARLKSGQPEANSISGVGGAMDFGLTVAPDTLNPILTSVESSWLVLDAIYSRLVDKQPLTDEAIPNLARSWIIEPEGDGLKLTFNLVSNATWHDDTPFTSSDVNFTYYYIRDLPGPWPVRDSKPVLNFTSIDVINNVTIVIHTPLNGYNNFIELVNIPILPEHIWKDILQPVYFTNPRPVGTGPFRFVSRPEPGIIFLEYFEEYHFGFPGARQEIVYVDVPLLTWLAAGSFVIIMTALAAFWFLRRRPHGFEP